jgi:hypothetical protein
VVVKIRVLLGLGCALGLGCGTRISSTEGAASVASAAIAPAAVNPQFSGSDPLPRLSLDGPIRPRAPPRQSTQSSPKKTICDVGEKNPGQIRGRGLAIQILPVEVHRRRSSRADAAPLYGGKTDTTPSTRVAPFRCELTPG